MIKRFTGTIEKLCELDVSPYVELIKSVPVVDWPKMADPTFMGMDRKFRPLADKILAFYPGCSFTGIGLWSMDSGHAQALHKDDQPANWLVRVHVPIVTNEGVVFTMGNWWYHMEVGFAYRFNTLTDHAVENRGKEARLHFVMDIVA